MHAQLGNGDGLPVLGLEHGADVVQVLHRHAATVQRPVLGIHQQAQAQRIGAEQAPVAQRGQQRVAGIAQPPDGPVQLTTGCTAGSGPGGHPAAAP
jgi:hypothetical protein